MKDTFGDIEPSDSNMPMIRNFRPAVEISETKECYNIKVELPCVKKENISLALTPDNVMISAESKFEKIMKMGKKRLILNIQNFVTVNFQEI